MMGKDYVLSRRAMRILSESVNRIRIEKFKVCHAELLTPLEPLVANICSTLNNCPLDDSFVEAWNAAKLYVDKIKFIELFETFIKTGDKESELWRYWNIFLDDIMPVIIDLTRSFREANWNLHLSSIRRAMPLFFAFGRTNYCRWVPLYYEDCLNLETKFPLLHESFKEGDFVVHHTLRRGSGVPMDQALEKEYNKPAKGAGGIIGITRKKESVAKWNIIKHEKNKYTKFIDDICEGGKLDEYSVHHEFSESQTAKDEEDIRIIKNFIVERCDIGRPGKLANMLTGSVLSDDTGNALLTCIEKGEELYQEYRECRLIQKTKKLFNKISTHHVEKKKNASENETIDLGKIQAELIRTIDVARARGYSVKTLLSYEIVSNSYFIMSNGFLTKPSKSELLGLLRTQQIPISEFNFAFGRVVTIVDFMAQARKIESRRKHGDIKTFGDAITDIWNSCWKMAAHSHRIDFVFDLYSNEGIKGLERQRRARSESIRTIITYMEQVLPIPSEFAKFWASIENKIGFQQYFISWVIENYKGELPVYLGGCHALERDGCLKIVNGQSSLIRLLKCSYDEADDRIMFHLNHAVKVDRFEAAHVMTGDTDIFVNLMYHFRDWRANGLSEIWFHHLGNITPVHQAVDNLPDTVVEILPAIHALSGCDTTSKIGTKLQAFKAAHKPEYVDLKHFGVAQLDDDMYVTAEHFLLDCTTRAETRSDATFDDMRYSKYHSYHFKLDLAKFPCTSTSLRKHVQRAYYQCRLWLSAATKETTDLDPIEYGYRANEDGMLVPVITDSKHLPDDFPAPCKCLKCARKNVCICRVIEIECCDFCKCNKKCKNPKNS